jgi:O-antigen ligase
MIWLLGGYMWLFVHRPFEVWPSLGALQIERGYMLVMLLAWAVTPGKGGLPNRIHAALTFFTLVLAASWLCSPYADMPGVSDVVENYFKVAVFYVLVVTTVRDERGLRRLVLLYLAAISLYMAHSLLEFTRGRYEWRMGIRRMVGVDVTFGDPNAFATTLLYALPLTLPFWFERPRRLPRALLLGFSLAACACILLTGSRAGLVGLLTFGGIVLFLSFRRKASFVAVSALAAPLAVAVLTVALPDELQNRYLTLVDSSKGPANAQTSADGRIEGFLAGIRAWERSPLLGHGPGTFALSTGRPGGAHNVYGQTLSEVGVLGAVALAGLVVCFTWNWLETRRLYRECPGLAPPGGEGPPPDLPYHVSRAVFLNVLLLLLMGWSGHNLFRYNWQWFAAFQAIALHCVRRRAEARARAATYALPYLVLPRARPLQRAREEG